MPPRRTSPRRSTTRPTVPYTAYERDDDGEHETGSRRDALASAAPWLALGALAIAALALALTFFGRGSNLDACRRAAWSAVPSANDLPTGWTLSSTDLNANGMTVSITGQAPPDGSSSAPVIYASVTCYGDVAETAIDQYRAAAKAADAKVIDRGQGGDAYDVDNSSTTGSVTTLFRVGGLIGQVAVGGFVDAPDLAKITGAVAAGMGDRTAAGTSTDQAGASPGDSFGVGSPEPTGSEDLGSAEPPAAPELEAHLPTDIAGTALTVQSGSAADGLGADPNSRALAAAMRGIGVNLADLQIAQASDPNAQVDPTTALDLDIFAFRVKGGDVAKLSGAVIDSWLSAGAPGVKQTQVKLAGKTFTKIDYGDGGRLDYVFAGIDYVMVVETSDADIATEVASKLK
jgi:hypothetical protein